MQCTLRGKCMNNLRTPPKFLQKPSPLFFHGAFAPSYIWRRRPWCTCRPVACLGGCRCWFAVLSLSVSTVHSLCRLFINKISSLKYLDRPCVEKSAAHAAAKGADVEPLLSVFCVSCIAMRMDHGLVVFSGVTTWSERRVQWYTL